LPTQKKVQTVEQYKELIENQKAIVITDFIGLTVEEINIIRRKLEKVNAKYKVVKNTLFKIATQGTALEDITKNLTDTNGVVFVYDDPVAVSKTLNEIFKEFEKFQFKVGLLEGKEITKDDLETLAKLPSLDVLRGQLLALFMAPGNKLVTLFSQIPGGFLNVLNSYKNKMEGK